jgi:diadenylate cyclase
MEQQISQFLERYFGGIYFPEIGVKDIVEVILLTIFIYYLVVWIKNTKAWMLLKGIVVLALFILAATLFKMHTILFIVKNTLNVMAIAAVVVFHPELRRALEKLGERRLLSSVVPSSLNRDKVRFSEATIDSIVEASFAMSKVKTGALIVVERAMRLNEYESTGIQMDCVVSKQVLLNIFEHNTPLHDGAIIIRGDRIAAATCYLPLSDNMDLSKDLGTRHRAAVGISEVSDAFIIAVSEETGAVSVASGGALDRNVTQEQLREKLLNVANLEGTKGRFRWSRIFRKGGKDSDERKAEA